MAYLEIDGYKLPTPKRGVESIVFTLVDSGRNANGIVVGQKIGETQYKFNNLEWPLLTSQVWNTILTKLEKIPVKVTFQDPIKNTPISRYMYCGDRTAEPYRLG